MARMSCLGWTCLARAVLSASLLAVAPAAALAQFPPPPDELAIGVGGVKSDVLTGLGPTAALTGSWDYSDTWRAVFVVEGELTAASEAAPCRQVSAKRPENCDDAALLAGFRLRPSPHNRSGLRPFVSVMVGEYWKGAGTGDEDHAFVSRHATLQIGGGVELRWPGSFQGLRLAVDYRRVFAGDRDTNQVRSMLSYVIGPRRFHRRP